MAAMPPAAPLTAWIAFSDIARWIGLCVRKVAVEGESGGRVLI